jgi:hypothetical protein
MLTSEAAACILIRAATEHATEHAADATAKNLLTSEAAA